MTSIRDARAQMQRFESRIFDGPEYSLQGRWDPQARSVWELVTRQLEQSLPEITEANVPKIRKMSATDRLGWPAEHFEQIDRCETSVLTVDGARFGSFENRSLEIRVHVPKSGVESGSSGTKRSGLVFYHGGAFVGGRAADEDPWASRLAADCDIVVFNVEFRNAPEARAPQGILDCYAALRCVASELAEQFQVDEGRIGIYGISSGGYLAAGVAHELARRDESSLVKLVIADVPAVSDHWAVPAHKGEGGHEDSWHWSQQEVEGWHGSHGHIETLKMLATDWDRQVAERDPNLFPGAMGDELMRKVPNHVVMTREFDFLRADSELYACDLLRCRRLLDFYVRPGASHYTGPQEGVLEKVIETYLKP